MLTLVRLRASIPAVTLNLKGKGRRRRRESSHLKSGFVISPTTQFLGCGCYSLTNTVTLRKMATLSGEPNSSTMEEKQQQQQQDDEEEVVVQYVVLRRDLIDTWPLGSVVTQGCHASVAAVWEHKDDASTLRYCSPPALDSMHKVTLEVKGESQIVNLSEKLKSNGILHKLWIEQPENFPTCLATKPYPKSVVSPFFRKLKLCK